MAIAKVRSETARLRLIVPDDYRMALVERPDLVDEIANGVGSETEGFFFHLTPDTNWGMNINPVSHPHDWMYTFPLVFKTVAEGLAHKRLADHWFKLNHETMIADGIAMLRSPRRSRAAKYDKLLALGGDAAFWADKPLPEDFGYYYDVTPVYDAARVARLLEIETAANALIEARYEVIGTNYNVTR